MLKTPKHCRNKSQEHQATFRGKRIVLAYFLVSAERLHMFVGGRHFDSFLICSFCTQQTVKIIRASIVYIIFTTLRDFFICFFCCFLVFVLFWFFFLWFVVFFLIIRARTKQFLLSNCKTIIRSFIDTSFFVKLM